MFARLNQILRTLLGAGAEPLAHCVLCVDDETTVGGACCGAKHFCCHEHLQNYVFSYVVDYCGPVQLNGTWR